MPDELLSRYRLTTAPAGLDDALAVLRERLPEGGEFTVLDLAAWVPLTQPLPIRETRQVRHQAAALAADESRPVVRVDSVRSGRYRCFAAVSAAELRSLKLAQPRARRRSPVRRETPRPTMPDGCEYPAQGDCLEIIESRVDVALVRCSNGRVYRITMQPVLL